MKTIIIALLVVLNGLANAQNSNRNRAAVNQQTTAGQQKSNLMENQAKQVVSEFLTAVQTGDQAKLAASLHPNVEWN
ncbi:MAG: nuclear transport factor 2 family protein, partial [Bacteroidetes bacterium]|nr:nuclear transport factor 2 family protein [Fibrella sp.]